MCHFWMQTILIPIQSNVLMTLNVNRMGFLSMFSIETCSKHGPISSGPTVLKSSHLTLFLEGNILMHLYPLGTNDSLHLRTFS